MTNLPKTSVLATVLVTLTIGLSACSKPPKELESASGPDGNSVPTATTIKANRQVLDEHPFSNIDDFSDAKRGFIAKDDPLKILNSKGDVIWDRPSYDFIKYSGEQGNAPSSVNPSLWRQAALNNIYGLFKVVDGVYQVRGYDLANMSIIEGDKGWIIIDPLTSKETANKALKLAQKNLGK